MAKITETKRDEILDGFTSYFSMICRMKEEANEDNNKNITEEQFSQTLELMKIEAIKELTKALNKVRQK